MTADDKTPVDQALDLFLYLPVGFLYELPRAIPRFIERGRRELHADGSATPGRLDPARQLARIPSQARGTLRALGVTPPEPAPRRSAKATATIPDQTTTAGFDYVPPADDAEGFDVLDDEVVATAGSTTVVTSSASASAEPAVDDAAVDADALAVPGYDSLSASQVVPRLDSLTADELEQVRRYEQANRGRKTILNKIAQLQAG